MSAEGAVEPAERRRVWRMLAAGTMVAALEAWMVCSRMRPPLPRFWAGALLWSAVCVGISVCGGAVAAWLTSRLERTRAVSGEGRRTLGAGRGSLSQVWRSAAAGWAFLPCLVLMGLRRSWWIFAVAALATVAAAWRLRPMFGDGARRERAASPSGMMRSWEELPASGAPPLRAFLVALSVQGCLLLAVRGALLAASAALAVGLALLIAGWTARNGRGTRLWAGDRRGMGLGVTAVLLTMLMVARWTGGGMHAAAAGANRGAAGGAKARAAAGQSGADYVGIILWPPPVKKADLVPPRPHTPAFHSGPGAKPLIIPFDGPYFYFKAPATEPGPKAHVTHGKPTEASVQSTDAMPLRMEAHQNLGLPIDLDCCREIDVSITNADTRGGRIDLALVLTDTEGQARRTLILGDEPVVSSERGQVVVGRPPVTETLKFALPQSATLRKFNGITVVIQPSAARARTGARIGVDQFELVPR